MSVLTKKEILQAISDRSLSFTPVLDAFQVQPHAIDMRLGRHFFIPKSWEMTKNGREALNVDYLDLSDRQSYFEAIQLTPGQYFEILPGESIIGTTLEEIHINDLGIMAVLYPRSSFNRRGLSVSLTGIIDAGYHGTLMLPIHNHTTTHTIRIYPGERVCQIVFEQLASTLTKKDAMFHGIKKAKYVGGCTDEITYQAFKKKEATSEIQLIRAGDIDELKKLYSIDAGR